jgi:hypothetical protein
MPILTYGLELIWEHLTQIHLTRLERVKANSASQSSLMTPVIRLIIGSLEKDDFLGCSAVQFVDSLLFHRNVKLR